MEVKPIITMKNFKRGTRVELLGIDISTALTNFDYSTQGEGSGNNAVTLEINIEELTKVLCGITPEDIKDKQKNTLEKLGILPDQIDNAGKAAKILDRLEKRRNEGLTTPKQIRFLEGRGFQHVGTWKFDTAKNLIDRIAGNGWRVPHDIVPQEYKGA